MSYEIGGVYRSVLAVTNSVNAPTDSATQVLTVTLPDNTIATPAVVHDGVGFYHADFTITQAGLHKFSWITTGPNTAKSDYLNVDVFRSVIGLDEAKNYINYGNSTNEDVLRQMMAATTELIEGMVGSTVQRLVTDEFITGSTKTALRLPQAPVPTATAVTRIKSIWDGGPVWVTSDFIVSPDSGVVYLKGMVPFYMGPWMATYTAGRVAIPQAIQLAAKEIIFDMWSTQRPYGADELEPGPEATARFEQMIATYTMPAHACTLLAAHEIGGFA